MTSCVHGMPTPASCIGCMDEVGLGPAPKPPVEVEALFAARFVGSCGECHLEIHEGQRIARLSDGRYVHEGCV